jgi:hypothetical protein
MGQEFRLQSQKAEREIENEMHPFVIVRSMCQTAGGGIPRQAFLRINKLPTSVDTFPNFGGYVCKSDAGCCSRRGGFRYRRLEGGLSDLLTEDGPSPCDAHIAALRYRGGLAAVGCV